MYVPPKCSFSTASATRMGWVRVNHFTGLSLIRMRLMP